tara:strand:- start:308 stop:1318 length:1011 start_codon:yes stop_codon:yes gene_type:complete
MIVTYVRSSSYNNYDYCQQQYYINYVLGHPSLSGKKAEMGTIVHKVMECLARSKYALQNKKKSFTDESLGRIRLTKDIMLSENFVNNLTDKSIEFYTDRSSHAFTKGDLSNCQKWVWLALEYNKGQFDPRKRKIVAAEPHFDIEINEPWAKYDYELPSGETISGNLAIKGTIDLVTESSEDVIEVVDWKTGRRIDWATGQEKDYEKLSQDPQLLLYNYAISKLFPEYSQSIMSIFYIRDGGPFSLCFDKSDRDKFLEMLKNRFEEIKANESPRMLSQEQAHWKCKKLCAYYKNNWEGTNTNICKHVHKELENKGLERTTAECTKQGFNIGYYDAPG